jgi:hypothetical protein
MQFDNEVYIGEVSAAELNITRAAFSFKHLQFDTLSLFPSMNRVVWLAIQLAE